MKVKITGFAKGIFALLISQILIKLFGVLYSIYMTNKNGFGDTGNAIYMSGYQIYALLLTISSMGVPNSISKLISEKDSIKDYKNANRIFYVAIFIFSIIGLICCLILFVFSDFIANKILLIPEAKLSLMFFSPAILFVSIEAVIRGYCNGENKISITAKSQFVEQMLKSTLIIVFIEIISNKSNNNVELMAASASLATTFATFFSLIYIIIKYKETEKRTISKKLKCKSNSRIEEFQKEGIYTIFTKIIKMSLPITISALLTSFCKNIDSFTVVRILKKYLSESDAIKKYGIISSKVDILIAFPLSFNTIISTALIPEISRKKAQNNILGIEEKIKTSIFLSLFIGIPSTFGMFFYSKEIFLLLFPNAFLGSDLLKLASISIIFSSLSQTITGILQGLGKNSIPLYATFFGIFGKIFCNIFFININGIYEKGAIIGNIALSIIMFSIELIYLKKYINININIIKIGCIPFVLSITMIIISKKILFIINNFINQNISIIISIIICIIIYVGFYYIYKILNKKNCIKNEFN